MPYTAKPEALLPRTPVPAALLSALRTVSLFVEFVILVTELLGYSPPTSTGSSSAARTRNGRPTA
jgi:hypothetical protein